MPTGSTALDYIPFLRDVGPHFTINRMLTFDSVKLRLDREQPLTFLEFNYMILQAYDFLELSRRAGCRLQMGGSDQWGNIVNGIELARRIDGTELYRRHHAADHHRRRRARWARPRRARCGSSADLLSPYDYWQFWRNTAGRRRRPVPAAVHRSAARRDRPAGEICRAPRSTRRRSCSRPKRPRCSTAARRRKRAAEPRAKPSQAAARATTLPTLAVGGSVSHARSADRRSAFARRTAKPSARSPRARSGSTTNRSAIRH